MNHIEHTYSLPIQAGDRPLFSTLPVIQNIYSHIQNNTNPFFDYSRNEILSFISDIVVFQTLIQRFGSNRIYFKEFKSLKLIFPKVMGEKWENMEWKKYQDNPTHTLIYEQNFSTPQKSSLYFCRSVSEEYIWEKWYQNTNINELEAILAYSVNCWLNWLSQCRINDVGANNIQHFSKAFDFNENYIFQWNLFEGLFNRKSNILDIYLKLHSHLSLYKLMNLFSELLFKDKEKISFNNFFNEDSALIKIGLFFLPTKNSPINSWDNYFGSLKNPIFDYLYDVEINQDSVFHKLLTPVDNSSIDIKNFSYIKETPILVKLMLNNNQSKLAILGNHDSGKTSFVSAIIKEAKLKAYTLNKDIKIEQVDSKLFYTISLIIKYLKGVLVFDNESINSLIKENFYYLDKISCKTVFLCDSKFFSNQELSKFSFSVLIPQLTTTDRLNIAKLYFEDNNIALKIAQRLKFPSLIVKLSNVCKDINDYSWNTISLLINTINSSTSDSFALEKWEAQNNILPFVGYPELDIERDFLVDYYKNPEKALSTGGQLSAGMLLVGPPGTGKTHFVKNISSLVDIPVYSMNSSTLAKDIELIPKTFAFLRKQAPCIFFLDEIDVLIANPVETLGINLDKQKILNTFLSNVDGLENNDGIFIIGTTNRLSSIDPAAKRSGRLNKIITLSNPEKEARIALWKCHLSNKKTSEIDYDELGFISVTFSCADIMEASNKAAFLSYKNNSVIDMDILKKSCDLVYWGENPESSINKEDFLKTCYHEAGHALLSALSNKNTIRITVKPSSQYLGATSIIKEEGSFDTSRESLYFSICTLLGGIAAESVIYGEYEQGGKMDLQYAKKLYQHAFFECGFSSLGAMCYSNDLIWSEDFKIRAEKEEYDYMKEAFEFTTNFLLLNKDLLISLGNDLSIQKEISGFALTKYFDSIKIPENKKISSFDKKISLESQVLHQQK